MHYKTSSKLLTIILCLLAFPLLAQTTNLPPTTVAGKIRIHYGTKTGGTNDTYTFDKLTICNSSMFDGSIFSYPMKAGGWFSKDKAATLEFNVLCDLINPRNPLDVITVGKIIGGVSIDSGNVYHYNTGRVRVAIVSRNQATGFESRFGGLAYGKRPPADNSVLATLNVFKTQNGKTVGLAITKYDKIEFQDFVFGMGPSQNYPEMKFNGLAIYDYDRDSWLFQNFSVTYTFDGVVRQDKISGNIKWSQSPNYKTDGIGQYDFDVRFNEPPPNENAAFSGTQDETAFFTTDNSIPAMLGTMKYKDTKTGDGVTTASAIDVDLTGNKLTKQQAMAIAKFLMVSVIPVNSD